MWVKITLLVIIAVILLFILYNRDKKAYDECMINYNDKNFCNILVEW